MIFCRALSILTCLLGLVAPVAQAATGRDQVLVVPFENARHEARLHWLTEASAVLVTGHLEALGQRVLSRDDRLQAFDRLQLPPAASLSEATIIRVGQLLGASQVILGYFTVEEGRLTVKARVIRLDTGRMDPEVVDGGPLADVFAVYERLARKLGPPAAQAGSTGRFEAPPLPVFEDYIKGLLADSSAGQVRFLESALRKAPTYDPARLALWQAFTARGDHASAASAALAVAPGSAYSARARFLSALSRIRLKQYDDAFQALKALLDESPTAAVYNNLGVIQSRRAPTAQAGKATYYFNKAAEWDREDPDCAFNLGYAYWLDRDPQAALYWLKETVRRNPADGDAHFVLGMALQSTGAAIEGEREKELARQLSSRYAEWERRPNAATEPVPKGLERLREDIAAPRLALVDAALVPAGLKDQQDEASFHLERGKRLFQEDRDHEAIEELRRSLYLSPYQPDAHLLLGRLYLRTGRLHESLLALKIAIWSRDSAAARAVLGEVYLQSKDIAAAREQLKNALSLDPQSADARRLAEKLGGK
ncbi:MAG TPA: tetratricopeptide repeat protein [Vicinamibacterales bacterium]|jgi:tetratricopeptide (TPR) repeat protein